MRSVASRSVVYRNSNTLVMKIESGLPRSDKFVHCLPASLNGRGNLKGFCGLSAAAMVLLVG
jgi:hypothetical protein